MVTMHLRPRQCVIDLVALHSKQPGIVGRFKVWRWKLPSDYGACAGPAA